jgi:hypothetical protein
MEIRFKTTLPLALPIFKLADRCRKANHWSLVMGTISFVGSVLRVVSFAVRANWRDVDI